MIGAEIREWGAVLEHVVDGREQGGCASAGCLLRASAPAKAEELCIEVAAFLAPGGPSTLDQQGLEPRVALAQPGGTALAGTLIVAWTQPGPRQEMSCGREAGHVGADFRQDDPR